MGGGAWVGEAAQPRRHDPEADKQGLDEDKAIALMLAQPSMIRRPVLDLGGRRILGFSPGAYAAASH